MERLQKYKETLNHGGFCLLNWKEQAATKQRSQSNWNGGRRAGTGLACLMVALHWKLITLNFGYVIECNTFLIGRQTPFKVCATSPFLKCWF